MGLRDWRSSLGRSCPLSEEFKEIQSKVDASEMPALKKQISDPAPAFKAAIETKPVELVVGDASKTVAIGTNLDPK